MKFLPAVIAIGVGNILYSCGAGGGGTENGASVVLELKSIKPSSLQVDLYDLVDKDNDGTCDDYYIPTDDILVTSTFFVKPVNPDKITPSDVNIYKYTVSYTGEDNSSPKLKPITIKTTCSAVVGKDSSCEATIVPLKLKKCILDYMVFAGISSTSYKVNIKFYGKEVLYDNDLDVSGDVRFDAANFIKNDDQCSGNPPYYGMNHCDCCQYIDDADYCAGC